MFARAVFDKKRGMWKIILNGIEVFAYLSGDGVPVVQIDTPEDSDVHEYMRVYMNDAEAKSWR